MPNSMDPKLFIFINDLVKNVEKNSVRGLIKW